MKLTILTTVAVLLLWFISGRSLRAAEDFAVTLTVSDGASHQEATTQPAAAAAPARPALECKVGGVIEARWKVTSTADRLMKDVLVHFYVVKTDRAGQAPPALEPKNVLVESALTMDFDPKSSTRSAMNVRPEEPGTYLVRIEADEGPDAAARITFAAVDLVVK